MLRLTNNESKESIVIRFESKTVKSKLTRLAKEINDLCLNIYRVNDKENVTFWIECSIIQYAQDYCVIDYVKMYYFIKALKNKVIRKKELISNNDIAAIKTNKTLSILKNANEKNLIMNYKSLKRKYASRLKAQITNIEQYKSKFIFVASTTYFFSIIKKQIYEWSGGPMSNVNTISEPIEDFSILCEAQIMDEFIKSLIDI